MTYPLLWVSPEGILRGYGIQVERVRQQTFIWVLRWWAALIILICQLEPAQARELKANHEDSIPKALEPWVPWVLDELGEDVCAQIHGGKSCIWPAKLKLDLKNTGGKFEQVVSVGATSIHTLPGQNGAWPEAVVVDGKAKSVLSRGGHATVELKRGVHVIGGRFVWDRVPETLHVGNATALITLSMRGVAVPLIKRKEGQLWLKELTVESEASQKPEQVELNVFRQLRDGSPLLVETRLVFRVSGPAREILLESPLLADTEALNVEGSLALALDESGGLRVQLVPGRHTITLLARAEGMPAQLASSERFAPWPAQEIWVWHPDTALRAVELSGPASIDASRTELPADWRSDSAYSVGGGDVLTLKTTRRAQAQLPSNRLSLSREFWLDEKAKQFTVRDVLTGAIHQKWRLNMRSGVLGQVKVGGRSQVITQSTDGQLRGVEVRDAQINLEAVSRVPRSSQLAAVGWSEDVDRLSATIHLPAGWDLFAATGVDDSSNTWLARWDLFSVFYVLVITLAMTRLSGFVGGVVSALALILAHGERDAPEYIWLSLVVLVALLSVIQPGKVRTVVKSAFYSMGVVALLIFISFSIEQVRGALYPHLNASFGGEKDFSSVISDDSPEGASSKNEPQPSTSLPLGGLSAPQAPEADESFSDSQVKRRARLAPSSPPRIVTKLQSQRQRSFGGKGSAPSSRYRHDQMKSDAIVQTGPGIPEVTHKSWQLSWSGPVVQGHQMHLYLLPPIAMRVLTTLRLLLLAALAFLLWRQAQGGAPAPPQEKSSMPPPLPKQALQASIASLFFLAILVLPVQAQADEPSDARLAQLKSRLTKPPSCGAECISVSSLQVKVGQGLNILAEVHAGAPAAYRLPGPGERLADVEIWVDERVATAIRLGSDGAYYLRLDEGVHQVMMNARLLSDRTIVDVGTAPKRIDIHSEGWSVTGVNDLGQAPGGTLTFQRDVELASTGTKNGLAGKGEERQSHVNVAPYFVVKRSLSLGVTSQVVTRITRLSDTASPETFRLRLLEGEQVTSPGIEVLDGKATISFSREVSERELVSTLTVQADEAPLSLVLKAPEGGSHTEVWELHCGVIWHCTTQGVDATSHIQDERSLRIFHPWPGEVLAVDATQPAAAAGSSLTVKKATLTLTPGIRMSLGELSMAVHTTRATMHALSIPPHAQLESVQVDGIAQSAKSDDGRVLVALLPGSRQIDVTWQEEQGLKMIFRSPQVDAGAAGVNFRVVMDLPAMRWLLLAGGPAQGPALLFWGYLVVILAAAWLLPRLPYAPLNFSQWLLLGLGLTQIDAALAVVVGGWFFAIGSRTTWRGTGRRRENLLQFVLLGYSCLFLGLLTYAVYEGLVSSPDMEVRGAGSHGSHLVWYSDRSGGQFASAWALSVSIWVWRLFMLGWALWLSQALLSWVRWAYAQLSLDYFWAPKPQTPLGKTTAGIPSASTELGVSEPAPEQKEATEPIARSPQSEREPFIDEEQGESMEPVDESREPEADDSK